MERRREEGGIGGELEDGGRDGGGRKRWGMQGKIQDERRLCECKGLQGFKLKGKCRGRMDTRMEGWMREIRREEGDRKQMKGGRNR